MRPEWRDRLVHVLFGVGIFIKGIDGALEVVGGALLFFISPSQLNHIVRLLTLHELAEEPHDLVATSLVHSTAHLSGNTITFGAIYLLGHGAVKVGLVAALLLKKRWAYPAAIVVFALFLAYQMYRYSHKYSAGLLVLSVLDVAVIVLTWLEYKRLRASHRV